MYNRYFTTVTVTVDILETDNSTTYVVDIVVIDTLGHTSRLNNAVKSVGSAIVDIDKTLETLHGEL